MKTIGDELIERNARLCRLEANPESVTADDVKWLLLQIKILEQAIPNDGYYC